MKKPPLVLFALPLFAAAAEDPSPAFPEQKIGVPPLSLVEGSKPNPLGILGEAQSWFRGQTPPSKPTTRRLFQMPVVIPNETVDAKMPIKHPDPSVDYKLIVKSAGPDAVK